MQSKPFTPGPQPASLTPPLLGPLIPPPPSQYGTPAWEAANATIWSPVVAAVAGCAPNANDAPPSTAQKRRRAPRRLILAANVETASPVEGPLRTRSTPITPSSPPRH